MNEFDLSQFTQPLEGQLTELSFRCKAALFGVCGYALLPTLRLIEERFMHRWTFPDAERALLMSRAFSVGASPVCDCNALRDRILRSVPNGHDLDSPWSTYAIDASVCIDAALVASSVDLHCQFMPSWLYYVLEPLAVALSPSGYGLAPELLAAGGRLAVAVDFLADAISELSGIDKVTDKQYETLLRSAAVISPLSEA